MVNKLTKLLSGKISFMLSQEQSMMLLAGGLGVYHSCLLALYTYYEMGILIAVNVFSVLLYISCAIAIKKKAKLLSILKICYGEIIMQVLVAGAMLGYECGFQFYLVAITCHAFYMGYIYRNDKKVRPMNYVLIEALAFVLLRWWTTYIPPVYTFRDPKVVDFLYIVNYFTAIIVIVVSMSILLAQIIHLEGQLLQENRDLEVLSHTDALTGLVNRRGLEEKYDYVMRHAERYTVILGDIDDFKRINDTFGHNAGDEVLRRVAEIMKSSVRGDDVVCRWGGEEILVFLPLCALDGAELTARRILERVRRARVRVGGSSIRFTMTFGITESEEGTGLQEVVQKADDRLYEGKSKGKNCIVGVEKKPRPPR